MKRILLFTSLLLCLFAVSCKKDSDDDASAHYVGKWFFVKADYSFNNETDSHTFNTCESKSNFNIETSGKFILQVYDECTDPEEYSGNYDDNAKKMKFTIDGEEMVGDVTISNNDMTLVTKETITEGGVTSILTTKLTLKRK